MFKSRIKVTFKYPSGDESHGYYDKHHPSDKPQSVADAKGEALADAQFDYQEAEWFKADVLFTEKVLEGGVVANTRG